MDKRERERESRRESRREKEACVKKYSNRAGI